jgi:hypothetical protein
MDTHHHKVTVRVKSVLDSCDDDKAPADQGMEEMMASQQVCFLVVTAIVMRIEAMQQALACSGLHCKGSGTTACASRPCSPLFRWLRLAWVDILPARLPTIGGTMHSPLSRLRVQLTHTGAHGRLRGKASLRHACASPTRHSM